MHFWRHGIWEPQSCLQELILQVLCLVFVPLQVDYVSRQLQRVYKLHAGPIWSLSVSDAFCATASEDGFIRVWPLTFQSCFMHVKSQEAAAVGVDGSEDGLQLLCTAADGSVGVLNLGSQQYQPLLRTHARPIRDAAAFEFQSSADLPTRVACHPLERVLAVGFDSGALRVFDIDAKPPQVMLEARHHLHSIRGIYFVRNAARDHRESHVDQSRCLLVAVDSCGAISIHDEQLEYQLTQRIENPGVHLPPGDMPPLAFSPGGEIMARYFDGRCICCFAFPSLLYKAKVCLPRPARRASASTLSALPYTASAKQGSTEGGAQITAYGFVGSGQGVLVVCSSDSKMRFYDLREASGPDPCPDSPFDEEGHSFTPPYWSPRSVTAGATQRSRSCTRGGCTPKTISLSGRPSTGCSDASKRCSSLSQRPVLPAASCFGVLSRCLTCIREIPLMSGAITAAIVTHFELDSQRGLMREEDNVTARAKDAFPQIALTAGTDNIVKLWNLDASPCLDRPRQRKGQLSFGWSACRSSRPSSGVVPGVSPSSPSRARSVFPSPVVNDLPPFQSFSGHLGTPFRLFVCGDLVVSVSSADVVLWAFQHRELEALAAQCVPLQFPQFRPPLCVHVDAARTKKNEERYESPHSLSLGKDLSGQFPVCRPTPVSGRSVVVLPSGPRHATRGGDTPDSSGMNGTEQAPGNPLRRMEASVAQAALCCSSQCSSSHPLACRSLSADSKTNTHSDLRGAPASESTSTNGGRPAASTDSDGRCQTEEVRCVETDCTYVEVIEPGDTSRLLQLRHIVGATVATSRGGCIWRPLQGLLCHAVGDWVLVERLDVRSRCDSEGKCLGLLPAQSSAAASLEGGPSRCIWRRSSDPLFRDLSRGSACPASSCEKQNSTRIFPFNRKSSAPGPGGFHSRSLGREAPKSCHARCVSPQPSTSRTGIGKRKEDKDFFGLACEKHRAARDHFSVCRDSRLGPVLTMAVNQKGTVLATIHTSRVQLEEVKGKFSGEEEERGFDKILAVWRLDDCMIARLVVLPRAWYSESPSGQEPTEAGKPVSPALAFCGTEYLVVASTSSRPHLDVYLLSDFLKVTPDLATLPIPPLQPAPVVGTAVDTRVVRLLTCAKTDDVEIVYISPRSTIFWKIDHVHSLHEDVELEQCHFVERSGGVRCGCDIRSTSRCLECDDHGLDIDHGLSLHFQFADLPWRMRDDPDLCHTSGCLTRRCPSSPTLLLLATNAGFVYGVNFDTNTLVFELQVATAEPVTFIACDRAQDLFCGLGSTLKRWSVDLVSLLPIPGTGEEEALQHSPPRLALVDLRGSTVSTEFQLDGVVKTMQSDAQAAEAVVSTSANTIWYLQWNQKARVRLQSGHTGPIRFVCSAYGLTAPCSRRFPRHHFSAEGKEQSRGSGGTVPSQLCRLDSSLPSCSEIFATAGDDLTIRLWSCWPRPQQVAIFSLKQRCCGLAFIQPDVLTAIFDNGCLRLIDIRCFRIVGRLQATPEGDAPTSLACVTENHALVATRSGVVLSIQLVTENPSGVSPKRLPHSGPETHQKTIKHASISRITALLFGNVGSTLQSTCSQEGDTSGESPWAPPPITHMAVSREFSKLSKDEASVPCSERELLFARVAVTTRGGLCAIGTYAPNRSSKHLTWLTDQSFVVKVPPRADQGHCYTAERADWSQAAFVGEDALVIVRASTVFLVRIAAKEVVKNVRVLDRVPDGCLNERQWMVASLAYLAQKKALVLILKGGSFLVLDVPSLFASSGPCRNIHPCLDQVVATVPSTELPSFVSVALIGPTHVLVGVKEVVTSVRIV
ncbi:WD domain, G-beta repeat-containing protein [Toxoplasma gondii VEG]|uniref:WD domain, G-beta repeat-containing protein n=3 Tax=Toxoplasma gondii TaxID=5811 RepID=V4ZL76_TOXGV|nr:WD domain, G-beta repeat-containing protein [Toxoplasma gondii VEG]KFG45632.1 WD domain, G-beta repeat-containing protein [Toxoplasma gondii p89]